MAEYHPNTIHARFVGCDINASYLGSVGVAVYKLFDPWIRPAMGSVGTNDDSAGQRIVTLEIFVNGFFNVSRHWKRGTAVAGILKGTIQVHVMGRIFNGGGNTEQLNKKYCYLCQIKYT